MLWHIQGRQSPDAEQEKIDHLGAGYYPEQESLVAESVECCHIGLVTKKFTTAIQDHQCKSYYSAYQILLCYLLLIAYIF